MFKMKSNVPEMPNNSAGGQKTAALYNVAKDSYLHA